MPPPSAQTLPALLSKIRTTLPASIPKSAAYILPACTLTALGHPNLLGPLFLHATGHQASSNDASNPPPPRPAATPAETRAISLQLRDVLLKEWTLIGIPLVITAAASLGAAEREAGLFPATPDPNAPASSSSTPPALGAASVLSARYASGLDVAPGTDVSTRGAAHLHRLYRHHLPAIMATWGSHEADFRWLEESVIYGLFLADHAVLSDLETSLVTVTGIMCQGLKGPTLWHLRGLRRLGVSKGDVEAVVRCVAECVAWAGGRVAGVEGSEAEGEEWVGWVGEVEGEV
ncbi:hypothetical protein GTA08_BOTSDO11281 [Neofusicoccum parvum]|nr:hypothetical protein GTA08_BOTSDO11281 [Neofusicoccum parvum]